MAIAAKISQDHGVRGALHEWLDEKDPLRDGQAHEAVVGRRRTLACHHAHGIRMSSRWVAQWARRLYVSSGILY